VARKGTWQRALLRWGLHQIAATATVITRIGERHQIQWLIYNPLLFLYFFGRSVSDAPGVVRTIGALLPEARSYLDVGGGSGGFAAQFKRTGRHVTAIEYNALGRWFTRRLGVPSYGFDLTLSEPTPVPGTFDVVYSFEVAEHLPPDLGQRLVEFMAQRANVAIVFTAAAPGQGGMGHINEQAAGYWADGFRAAGFKVDETLTAQARAGFQHEAVADWFYKNALVLRPMT
jgi:SAM-dependent methyltransferase